MPQREYGKLATSYLQTDLRVHVANVTKVFIELYMPCSAGRAYRDVSHIHGKETVPYLGQRTYRRIKVSVFASSSYYYVTRGRVDYTFIPRNTKFLGYLHLSTRRMVSSHKWSSYIRRKCVGFARKHDIRPMTVLESAKCRELNSFTSRCRCTGGGKVVKRKD